MSRRYGRGSTYSSSSGRRNGFDSPLEKPVWENEDLQPFQKNFYQEHPAVTARTQAENDAYMREHRMTLENTKLKPIINFNEICFPPNLLSVMARMRFERPTPIQAASWPILLSGSDLVGIAQTGSGKTLAYLLPGMVQAQNQPSTQPGDGPIILVLAPTRELAQQIQTVAIDFSSASRCRNCCLYGGASKRAQLEEYRRGVEIIIATPGRLIDFLNSCEVSMHRVTYLVLDEADRMLDMGFEPQIRKIIDQIRPDRQTCMFSATWPHEVRRLASEFLTHPAHVTIGDKELSANHNITQIVEVCSERDKDQKIKSVLYEILKERNSKTIVFAQTKQRVRSFHRMLVNMGFPVLDIHGDKKQMERDRTLRQFRELRRAILIATDVASRGLDVEDVKFVVNIDYPAQTEDYIHRIGRTARSNHHGTSYTFFTIKNKREAPKLIKVLKEAGQPVPDKLLELAQSSYDGGRGRKYRDGGADDRHMGYDRKRTRFDDDYSDTRGRKYPSTYGGSSGGYPTASYYQQPAMGAQSTGYDWQTQMAPSWAGQAYDASRQQSWNAMATVAAAQMYSSATDNRQAAAMGATGGWPAAAGSALGGGGAPGAGRY